MGTYACVLYECRRPILQLAFLQRGRGNAERCINHSHRQHRHLLRHSSSHIILDILNNSPSVLCSIFPSLYIPILVVATC